MAHTKLNKIAKMHLKASGLGHSEDPATDKLNGSDTPARKKKGPKECAPPADVKEVSVSSKPKGLK